MLKHDNIISEVLKNSMPKVSGEREKNGVLISLLYKVVAFNRCVNCYLFAADMVVSLFSDARWCEPRLQLANPDGIQQPRIPIPRLLRDQLVPFPQLAFTLFIGDITVRFSTSHC